MEYVTLSNGLKMPLLGFGVYQVPDLAECERVVSDAIQTGYRLIDTAQAYGNEEAVGRAIQKSDIPREDFFITSKIWISNFGYEKAKTSIEKSLARLQTDYIDLMLLHRPLNDYYGAYRALEEYYKAGKIKAIGVSNFSPDRLADLAIFNDITPMVNQVETHVFNQQLEAQKTMAEYGVQIESWGPFAEGKNNLFTNETLVRIGKQYNKTAAQVALRYLIQQGIVAIPKTVHKERMTQNLDIFDFSLSDEDMADILQLDKGESQFLSHVDPETVKRLSAFTID